MSEGLCADCIIGNKLNGTPKGSMVETPSLPAYFAPANLEDESQKVRGLAPCIDTPKGVRGPLAHGVYLSHTNR
jgi:hypothetical protein